MFNGKAVVIVTGASRGIGREIAIQIATKVEKGSHFVLVARDEAKLKETSEDIKSKSSRVDVTTVVADLTSEKAEYLQTITKLLSTHAADAALVLAVHNAGSVGDIHLRSHEMNDVARWHSHLQSNLIAAILLNNAVYNSVADAVNASKTRFVAIDITSLAAIRAGPSWTQYSVGKASREAYFRAFAVEHPDNVRVLSYSPGPVDTDMFRQVANDSYSDETRQRVAGRLTDGATQPALTPPQTVARLIGILDANKFESGTRIDYFDKDN